MTRRKRPEGAPELAAAKRHPECIPDHLAGTGPFSQRWEAVLTSILNEVSEVVTDLLTDTTPETVVEVAELVRGYEIDLADDLHQAIRLGIALALHDAGAWGGERR